MLVEVEARALDFRAGIAAVGRVAMAGADATELIGRRVVVGAGAPCGVCPICRRGRADVCPAGSAAGRGSDLAEGAMSQSLATHLVAAARWVCPESDSVPFTGPSAALAGREAALAYTMYTRLGVAPGEPLVILGSGAVARFAAQIARALGARSLGSDELAASDAPAAILATEGATREASRALEVAQPASRIALYRPGEAALDHSEFNPLNSAVERALALGATLIGVPRPHPDLVPELLALAGKGDIDLAAGADELDADELEALADDGAVRARIARAQAAGRVALARRS